MASTSGLRGTWKGGRYVGNHANVVIALYVNATGKHSTLPEVRAARKAEQRACFTILKEWVRQHILEVDYLWSIAKHTHEIEGRGYLWELSHVKWADNSDPFYRLLQRTLDEMAETFNLREHDNCSTPYALEYSWVRGHGMEYDSVRLGAYAYAVGVKVETEVAADYLLAEDLSWVTDQM